MEDRKKKINRYSHAILANPITFSLYIPEESS